MTLIFKEKEAEPSSSFANNESDAPPPYTSVPAPGNADYRNTAPSPRTFHIYHEGLSGRKQTVMENDKTTKAYDVQSHTFSKPHIKITSGGATGHEVGAVTFHHFSRTLDLVINGKQTQLEPEGWFTRSFSFMSSIAKLRWEHTSVWGGSLACVTDKGEWLARFDRSYFALKKDGKLEIVNSQLPQELVDELVVSGLAMVEVENRRNNSGSAGGGGGGGGGC